MAEETVRSGLHLIKLSVGTEDEMRRFMAAFREIFPAAASAAG